MEIIRSIIDVVFPIQCVGCGRERTWLCQTCALRMDFRPFRNCPNCRKGETGGRACSSCAERSAIAGLITVGPYADPLIRGLIHGLKYRKALSAEPYLATLLRRSHVCTRIPQTDCIIPLPLYRTKQHDRGFNQAELIAREASKEISVPVNGEVLRRIKEKRPQAKLAEAQREKNVQGVFSVTSPRMIEGKRILLVDDVFTTGSTMREAARVLREAGASEVWGFAVAYG